MLLKSELLILRGYEIMPFTPSLTNKCLRCNYKSDIHRMIPHGSTMPDCNDALVFQEYNS